MPHFKHILFPVDFSDRCRVAEPFVLSTARRFQARLTLLHVVHVPAGLYGSVEAPYPMFDLPGMLQAAEEQLASCVVAPEPLQIDRVVQHGDVGVQIAAFAQQNGVDLIMMPTHGYGKFRGLLLGSTTAKVLHDAHCPVWTAAHAEDPAVAHHLDCRSMLCAISLAPESVDLIRYAVGLATEYQAKLRLVHAASAAEMRSITAHDTEFRQNLLAWTREHIAALQRQAGSDLEVCLEGGSASSVVREAALHHNADLVVIGRGKGQTFLGNLRTHAYSIICESPCPVLRA